MLGKKMHRKTEAFEARLCACCQACTATSDGQERHTCSSVEQLKPDKPVLLLVERCSPELACEGRDCVLPIEDPLLMLSALSLATALCTGCSINSGKGRKHLWLANNKSNIQVADADDESKLQFTLVNQGQSILTVEHRSRHDRTPPGMFMTLHKIAVLICK